jgi:hypothetical protein
MRPAHHAGHIMPGQRKPHRKMAADRASAEDTDSHGWCFLKTMKGEFPRGCVQQQLVVQFA